LLTDFTFCGVEKNDVVKTIFDPQATDTVSTTINAVSSGISNFIINTLGKFCFIPWI